MDYTESITLLTVWANALLMAVAVIYHPAFFWLLLISIPLSLACLVYIKHARQLNRSVYQYPTGKVSKTKMIDWFPPSARTGIKNNDLKIIIGNHQCGQPYNVSIFNIRSAKHSLPAHWQGRQLADTKRDAENRCRKRLSTYCLAEGDLVLQVRKDDDSKEGAQDCFNSNLFREAACRPEVKLIEVLFTTGTVSLHSHTSPSKHPESYGHTHAGSFGASNAPNAGAEGLIHFLGSLRELSRQKPIGIRFYINDKLKLYQVCYAIRKTLIIPDFLVVEGGSESLSPRHTTPYAQSSMPLYEALEFVSQTLRSYGLEKKIQVIAAAEVRSAFDLLKLLALGAHAACFEPSRYQLYRETDPLNQGREAAQLQHMIIKATRQAMEVCGCRQVSEITLPRFFRRLDALHTKGNGQPNDQAIYFGIIKRIYDTPLSTMYTDSAHSAGG